MSVDVGRSEGRASARPRHLANAPITEAVIDFRVQPRVGLTVDALLEAAARIGHEYPMQERLRSVQARLHFGHDGVSPDVQDTEVGIAFKSADGRHLTQFRLDGFSFHRLEPYTSWSELYPETVRLWRLYAAVAEPLEVTRLAARYINRLKLPLSTIDLDDFLMEPPRVPIGLPQNIAEFLTRLVIHDPALEQFAIVTQGSEPNPADLSQTIVLLDIDAFSRVSMDWADETAAHRVLGQLHDFKNSIFFSSITQHASELFE